jgi:trk system potassium uptake protein TrkH
MVMCFVFMFIGGSSGSTAGGIKTVTAGILILAVRADLRGSDEVTIRGRAISARRVMDAMTLAMTAAIMLVASAMVVSLVEPFSYLSSLFEVASAMGTVGLSTGITTSLSGFSRVLFLPMYLAGWACCLSLSRFGNKRVPEDQNPPSTS